jgi:hypothetical protein
MKIAVLPGRFAVCRLAAGAPIPEWAKGGPFVSITRTADELSIVCLQESMPPDAQAERDFRAFKVEGPLDFSLTGLLANLSGALAAAGISLFAVSTFDTDYMLVRDADLERAISALTAGHQIERATGNG